MTNKRLLFSIDNIKESDRKIDKSQFTLLKVDAFSTSPSLHDTFVSEETLKRTASSILLKPFVFVVDKRFDDLGGHDEEEVPGGFVPHDSPLEFHYGDNGELWFSCEVLVWNRYSGKLLEYFSRDDNKKGVSVEIEIYDEEEKPNGLTELLDFVYTAITCLGDLIQPAIPNAQAVLQFSKEYEKAKREYELEFSKYSEVDFTIPQSVKNSAKKALESKNGSSVALALARFLLNNEKATPERVRQMAKYFKRKSISEEDVAFGLFGGKPGRKWSLELSDVLDAEDEKVMSYFEGGGNEMPYTSMKDVNPSVKGIDPPVSLSQANEIAKAADAIGTDEDKKGWAIAISNFKKNHEVKDGKWVKKEKMSEEEFAKDDLGKGEAIEVDKSKDSMVSGSWGNVDKTALRNKVLNASNYKSLVKDVYLLVEDGYEDHPSSSLKYPVMQISDGKLVYNRYGLGAALQRASGQNETEVVSKVHGIYKKLGLDGESEKESYSIEFALNASQMFDILNNCVSSETYGDDSFRKYWVEDYDDICVYIRDNEDEKVYCASYMLDAENKTAEIDMATKHLVIRGGYEAVGNNDKEENLDMAEVDNKDKLSYAEVMGKEEMAQMFAAEEGDDDEAKEKFAKGMEEYDSGMNPVAMCHALYAALKRMGKKMEKMSEDSKAYLAENEDLKKKFADQEDQQKAMAVDAFMKEMAEMAEIPEKDFADLKEKAKEFSFAELGNWKNYVKAFSFDYKKTEKESDGITRFALPYTEVPKQKEDVWAK